MAFLSGRADTSVCTEQGVGCPGQGIKLTTDLHLVLKLRNNGIIPSLPPCVPSLMYNGYRVFPGGKERPGRDADPSPLLVPWLRKSRAKALLPLWAVRPVQSLSDCTRVHSTLLSPICINGTPRTALPVRLARRTDVTFVVLMAAM